MANPIQSLGNLGQSVWLDYIRRGMLESGEFQQFIDMGITGVTSNPTIFEKAIVGSTDYDKALVDLAQTGKSTQEVYEALAVEDIQTAADMLRPVYDRTGGVDGYVSLEANPLLAADTQGTIEEARRLFVAVTRPNVMIKVPGTPEGIPAITELIGDGINVNVTLIFSLTMYDRVREAYVAGLEKLDQNGGNVGHIASVASFFVSRVDTSVDRILDERISQGLEDMKSLLGKAAVSNAKIAYQQFRTTFESGRFEILKAKGARVQRPLWASTSTKNPAYSDVLYVEPLVGVKTVNTMPLETIDAFMDHGQAHVNIEAGVEHAQRTLTALEAAGISMESVTAELLADGVKSFSDSFEKLLDGIDKKRQQLVEG